MEIHNSFATSGLFINGKYIDFILTGVLTRNMDNFLSLSYHLIKYPIPFSGETALKSSSIAQYYQLFFNSKKFG